MISSCFQKKFQTFQNRSLLTFKTFKITKEIFLIFFKKKFKIKLTLNDLKNSTNVKNLRVTSTRETKITKIIKKKNLLLLQSALSISLRNINISILFILLHFVVLTLILLLFQKCKSKKNYILNLVLSRIRVTLKKIVIIL